MFHLPVFKDSAPAPHEIRFPRWNAATSQHTETDMSVNRFLNGEDGRDPTLPLLRGEVVFM